MISESDGAVDFFEPADLFSGRTKGVGTGYRRFVSMQAAVVFSIDNLPSQQLNGAAIETFDTRYAAQEIRALYERPDFPRGPAER